MIHGISMSINWRSLQWTSTLETLPFVYDPMGWQARRPPMQPPSMRDELIECSRLGGQTSAINLGFHFRSTFWGFIFRWMSKKNSPCDISSKTWVYPHPIIPARKSEDELWFDNVQSSIKNFTIRDWIVVVWEIIDPDPWRICLGRRSLIRV